jgi:predicted nucleic acid-binding protein
MTNSIHADKFVTDTMGFILRMEKRRLSPKIKQIFDDVEAGKAVVYIPAIVFSEILYLSEKKRIDISIEDVIEYLKRYPNYIEYPLSFPVIQTAARITDIRELHDRLIAGTSLFLNLNLITNDPVIQASSFVSTFW